MYESKQNPPWRKITSYPKGNVFSILENNPGAEKTCPLIVYFARCQHRKYKTEIITSENPLWVLRTNIAISSYMMLKVSLSLLYVKRNFTGPFAFYMVFLLARTLLFARDGSSWDTILSRLAKNTSTQVFKPVKPSGHFVYNQV